MKKISRRSWHARTYLWWYIKKYGRPHSASAVNLCPYVRAVVLWAPARLLFLSKVKYFAWPALGLLAEYGLSRAAGWRKLLLFELIALGVLLGGTVLVAAMLGVGWLVERTPAKEKFASFGDVLRARYNSAHDRVCPRVEFDK